MLPLTKQQMDRQIKQNDDSTVHEDKTNQKLQSGGYKKSKTEMTCLRKQIKTHRRLDMLCALIYFLKAYSPVKHTGSP